MRYPLATIAEHLCKQVDSGLSVIKYCQLHNLAVPTFYYWRRRHAAGRVNVSPPSVGSSGQLVSAAFIQVEPVVHSHAACRLTTPGGTIIDLDEVTIEQLSSLVARLEQCDNSRKINA